MKQLVYIICFVGMSMNCQAQSWTGNVNSDWNNPANWSTTPSNGDDIQINLLNFTGAAASPVISSNSNFSPAAVEISNGASLTISANLTTQDDVEVINPGSSLIVTAGVFNVNVNNGGRLIIDLGATMTLLNGTVNVGERFIAGEDAVVTIENGIATSGERLLMDLGGSFIQNGGSVEVDATFAMADGNANSNSSYTLNNGTLTITGEMGFENESGNFEPTFTQNGGTLLLNGTLFWFGEAPGTGTPKCLFQGGSATINGVIENMPLSTVNMYLKLDNNASVTFNGNRWETINALDSVITLGNSLLLLNNTHDIINAGAWYSAENASTHFKGITNLLGSGTYQFYHVYVNGTMPTNTLNHTTNSPLNVSGDFFNINTFVPNSNTVIFNGLNEQSLSSQNSLQFYNVEVNNSSSTGLTFVNSLFTNYSVAGHLELSDGIVYIGSTETLTLLDNATANAGSNDSYINGALHKIGNDPFVFPIGKNNRWRRLEISAPGTITTEFKAEYFDNSYSSISPVNSPISSVSNTEYWQLEQLTGTDQVAVGISWEDASTSYITDCNELSMAHWNGSSWDNILSTTSGSCIGSSAGSILTNSNQTDYGVFTFGFYSGVTTQNISICQGEEIVVGTNTYTSSGTYVDVLLDQSNADSVVITQLTVGNPVATVFSNGVVLESNLNSNYNYQWINCGGGSLAGEDQPSFTPINSGYYALVVSEGNCLDTSSCIYYTIVDTTICNGTNYQVGTSIYTTSDTYSDNLTATTLEDSVVISNLTVNAPNIVTSTSGITITSLASNALYQWIDCATNTEILNANNQSYTPISNGSYAVEITENGCVDTSSCIVINSVGLSEKDISSNVKAYPNPFDQNIIVDLNGIKATKLKVINAIGQVLYESELLNDTINISTEHYSKGIYFVEIIMAEESQLIKLIKN